MGEKKGGDIVTEKQKRFADEYLIDLNATRAYKAAYQSVKSDVVAATNGGRLLRNAEVSEYVGQILTSISNKKIADATEVMEYLTSVMRREHKEIVVVTCKTRKSDYDENGKKRIVDTEEPVLVEIPAKLSDANKAAELLGKRYGIFTENIKLKDAAPVMIIDNIPRGGADA